MTGESKAEVYNFNNGHATYNKQIGSAYSKSSSYYPLMYAQEKNSVIDGSKKENGLEMSEQSEFINDTENAGSARGIAQAQKSIQPYQKWWYKNSTFMRTAFKDFSEMGSNAEGNFYDLITPKEESATYWLASRSIVTISEYCSFGVRYIFGGSVDGYVMCTSTAENPQDIGFKIFPVVSISAKLIEKNDISGYEVNL